MKWSRNLKFYHNLLLKMVLYLRIQIDIVGTKLKIFTAFGREPRSEATIQNKHFHQFKMKCQIDKNISRQGDGTILLAIPLVPSNFIQQQRGLSISSRGLLIGPKVSLGGSSTFSAISDIAIYMDIEGVFLDI